MPFDARVLNVMISAPGDVAHLVTATEQAVHKWNNDRAQKNRVVMLPRHWSTDTVSSFSLGADGQAEINDQLVNGADIVIAIFHARLGTRTPRAASGTAEEIGQAIADGLKVHVYFCTDSIPADHDEKQWAALKKFRGSLESKGLYATFKTSEELAEHIGRALEKDSYEHEQVAVTPSDSLADSKFAISVEVEGSAYCFQDTNAVMEQYMHGQSEHEFEIARKRQTVASDPFEVSIRPVTIWGDPEPKELTVAELEDRIPAWKNEVRENWQDGLDYLCGARNPGLQFRIANVGASYLKNVQVILTFIGAEGVDKVGAGQFEFGKVMRPINPADTGRPYAFDIENPVSYPVKWKNVERSLEVVITLNELRPHPVWCSADDDVVLVLRDVVQPSILVKWTATAEGHGQVLEGETVVGVAQPQKFGELLHG